MWFSEYEPVVKFGNLLNWTKIGLGNLDFDPGTEDIQGNCSKDFSYQTNFSRETKEMKIKLISKTNLPTLAFLNEIKSIRKEA